jgi:VanZ family protein
MIKWLLWAAVAAYVIGIWWLSSQGEQITARVDAAGITDFNAHFILFGGLSFLLRLAMYFTWPASPGWLLSTSAAAGTFAYGAIDEWHQSFVPGRGVDAQDLTGDFIGALGGQLLAAGCIWGWRRLF